LGFFKDEEIDALRVKRMIIHVVGRADEEFDPQPEITVQEEPFFRSRIVDEAADPVHSFVEGSDVKYVIERMAQDIMTFEAGGQNLSRRFFDMHVKQSVAGAFFVLELSTSDADTKIYALIKYDYRQAVELTEHEGRNVLRAIVQAFIKERRAVQKICLVRVESGSAQVMVSASDRMKDAPDLTDYFERYLGVTRTKTTAELSRRLNEALRQSLEDVKPHLPERNVGKAVAAAKKALRVREVVSNDDVVDAVLHAAGRPEDEKIITDITAAARKRLKRNNLQDVSFKPDKKTLEVLPRLYVRTVEQVRLEFPSEELDHSVFKSKNDKGITFTIHTKELLEDGTLSDKPGKSP
jgi:hypothetical protein